MAPKPYSIQQPKEKEQHQKQQQQHKQHKGILLSQGYQSNSMSSTTTSRKRQKPVVQVAEDLDIVMKECRKLKAEMRKQASKSSPKDEEELAEIPSGIMEVTELSSTEVLEGIEAIALTIANQVVALKGFSMEIPSRAASVRCFIHCK